MDTIKINEIKFPVISFSQNLIFIIKTLDSLTTCGSQAIRKNFYKDMLIVDSSSKGYRVENAKKVDYAGPLWGFRLLESRRIKVELSFKGGSFDVPLEQLKQLICNAIDKNKYFWQSAGDTKNLKNEIMKASNFDEIIRQPFLPTEDK